MIIMILLRALHYLRTIRYPEAEVPQTESRVACKICKLFSPQLIDGAVCVHLVTPTLHPWGKVERVCAHSFGLHKYRYVCLRVDISIVAMRDASNIKGYDRRTPELSNAPLPMEQDNDSIE